MAATYEPIATTTLGSAASSITFSSIPSTYTDIVVVFTGTMSTSGAEVGLRFNAVDYAYSLTRLRGNGTTASSESATGLTYIPINIVGLTSTPFFCKANVFSYAGSKAKTVLSESSEDNNGSGWVIRNVGLWNVTDAITSIQLVTNAGNYNAGCTATLYGIKAA